MENKAEVGKIPKKTSWNGMLDDVPALRYNQISDKKGTEKTVSDKGFKRDTVTVVYVETVHGS